MLFEALIRERPVSLQTKNKRRLDEWKQTLRVIFTEKWDSPVAQDTDFRVTLVYLCGTAPVDIDNIVKPILDSMGAVIYRDDILVTDVDSHRRPIFGETDLTNWPSLLIEGLARREECVYVRVQFAQSLEAYL